MRGLIKNKRKNEKRKKVILKAYMCADTSAPITTFTTCKEAVHAIVFARLCDERLHAPAEGVGRFSAGMLSGG